MARKKLGKLPPRDEAEITAAAIVTPHDIDEAKAHARRYGARLFVALQEAEREQENTRD